MLVVATIWACGCVSQTVKDQTHGDATALRRFNALVESGKTSREQERAMLRASQKAFEALDEYLSGNVAPVGSGS